MTHTARKKGESGFYHVVIKGDGGQIIFEDEQDRLRFLETLAAALEAYPSELHAYCLMSNHVHLLLREKDSSLSDLMKKLDETYARYFAKKTGRIGSVLRKPFWSEPIDSEPHYLSTLRYIHANPEPARICLQAAYPWSSYRAYMGETQSIAPVETEFALSLLGGAARFAEFSTDGNTFARPFPKSRLGQHLSPDELSEVALAVLGRETLNDLRQMKPPARLPHLQALARAGFTDTEIARITGIGQTSISRALKS